MAKFAKSGLWEYLVDHYITNKHYRKNTFV